MLSMGSIIGGGFRLIREKPGAVAVWALIYLAIGIATTFVMRPFFEVQAQMMGADPAANFAAYWSVFKWVLLFQLVAFLLFVVMFTASLRAVLRPDEGGLGYLRFGKDELRMIALAIFLGILFYVGLVVAALVLVAILVPIFAIAGGSGAVVAATFVPLLIFVAALCIYVRLSLSFPLTLMRRRIVIGESWRLTSGHFWTLFGAFLVIFLILIVFSVVVGSITAAPFLGDILQGGFSPENVEQMAQEQLRQVTEIGPMTIVGWILNAIGGGLTIALFGGATATAARELSGDVLLAREFA